MDGPSILYGILLLCGILLAVGQVFGLSFDGDHDIDGDCDHDVGGDHDAEGDHDAAGAAGHDHSHGHDLDDGHDHTGSAHTGIGHWFGIGQAPITIVLASWFTLLGTGGLTLQTLLDSMGWPGWSSLVVSLPTTLVAALYLTGVFARAFGKLLPRLETYPTHKAQLVGCTGKVTVGVCGVAGWAKVRSRQGDLIEVTCVTRDGSFLPFGTSVILVEFNSNGSFIAEPYTEE